MNPNPICLPPPPNRILPLPLFRKNVNNDQEARKKLLLKGHKHISKVSAIGKTTLETLAYVRKSRNIRMIYQFHFDPYLCELSYIRALCQTFKHFKNSIYLNIVIRRMDYLNEANILGPFLQKHTRMIKLRFELPRTNNIDDKGLLKLSAALGKCYSIRVLEEVVTDLVNISEFVFRELPNLGRKRLLLEDITFLNHRTGVIKNETDIHVSPEIKKSIKNNHLKKMNMAFGISTGWFSMSSDFEETTVKLIKSIGLPPRLTHLKIKLEGAPVTLEIIQAMLEIVPNIPGLKLFSLEFLNSRVSETEVVILTQTLPKMTSVEHLIFKVIQYPNISDGCINYFVNCLSKLENFKKFDLYFRRLSVTQDVITQLVDKILTIEDVQVSRFKQSLYIYKNVL